MFVAAVTAQAIGAGGWRAWRAQLSVARRALLRAVSDRLCAPQVTRQSLRSIEQECVAMLHTWNCDLFRWRMARSLRRKRIGPAAALRMIQDLEALRLGAG